MATGNWELATGGGNNHENDKAKTAYRPNVSETRR